MLALEHVGGQVFFGARSDDAPGAEYQETIAGFADLGEHVARDQHGVVGLELANHVAHLDDLHWVQAAGWFVEDEQLGLVDDRLGNADALAKAVRERADDLVVHIAQVRCVFGGGNAATEVGGAHAAQAAGEREVVADGHVVIDRR